MKIIVLRNFNCGHFSVAQGAELNSDQVQKIKNELTAMENAGLIKIEDDNVLTTGDIILPSDVPSPKTVEKPKKKKAKKHGVL